MTARTSILTVSAILACSSAARAQTPPACETPPGPGQAAAAGRVVDTETKLPLQEATVRILWEERVGTRRTQEHSTDADGYFTACELPAGVRARFLAEFGATSEAVFVDLVEGETRPADLEVAAPRSRVAGRVVEAGTSRGIAGVELLIPGSTVRGVSASDGSFRLPDVPPGDYELSTSHIAYGGRTDSVSVQHGTIMNFVISLAPDVIAMAPIEVSVRSYVLDMRGFYERQERGFGSYLTRFTWENQMPRLPSDILRQVAGVRIMPARGGFGSVLMDRSDCAFRYVLDGARVGETFQLDDIPVEWIEGLEVYRGISQVPGEFTAPPSTARANCGVIVVWTRGAR
jgi:hypothetical protein